MSNVEQAYQKVYNTEGSQNELTAYAMKKLTLLTRRALEKARFGKYGPIVIHGTFLDHSSTPSFKDVQGDG